MKKKKVVVIVVVVVVVVKTVKNKAWWVKHLTHLSVAAYDVCVSILFLYFYLFICLFVVGFFSGFAQQFILPYFYFIYSFPLYSYFSAHLFSCQMSFFSLRKSFIQKW